MNRPKTLVATLLLPLAYGPRHYALTTVDRFLRLHPRGRFAGPAYHRALFLARESKVVEEPVTLLRSIILKAPDHASGERGLLLTSFESELAKLARSARLRGVVAEYDVAFLPTWQPFYSLPLYQYVTRSDRPLFLMPSSGSDYELCRRRHDDVVALPFQASSWVNAELYHPAAEKDIDIIMVANFSPYKRHWHLFRALRDLPRHLRVVLVGVPFKGRGADAVIREARAFGTADRFELYESPSDSVVSDLLARAKVFLGLSAKEGSYIAVAEALSSGTPVGLYRDALIGSKEYVNEETGVLFDSGEPLAPQITRFLERAGSFAPQRWARANISSQVNGRRLNDLLRTLALKRGSPWSRDIAAFYCRHFDFHYERVADAKSMAPEYERFRNAYAITIMRSTNAGISSPARLRGEATDRGEACAERPGRTG